LFSLLPQENPQMFWREFKKIVLGVKRMEKGGIKQCKFGCDRQGRGQQSVCWEIIVSSSSRVL